MAKKYFTIRYRRTTIRLKKNPRKGICECCGRKGKTDKHHWIYEFKTKEVKENPKLALKNTSELCFVCHNLANSLKHVVDKIVESLKLWEHMPKDMKKKWNEEIG